MRERIDFDRIDRFVAPSCLLVKVEPELIAQFVAEQFLVKELRSCNLPARSTESFSGVAVQTEAIVKPKLKQKGAAKPTETAKPKATAKPEETAKPKATTTPESTDTPRLFTPLPSSSLIPPPKKIPERPLREPLKPGIEFVPELLDDIIAAQ